MRGGVYQRGRTWTWQFTTGRRSDGTRRHHSRGGYTSEQAARDALGDAVARHEEQRQNGALPRVAPALIDNAVGTILDLIDSGTCTAACVLAEIAEDACVCRCGGEYHGMAREGRASKPDPRAMLRGLASERSTYDERELSACKAARAAGMEWVEIGQLSGRNPEHLSRRWGKECPKGLPSRPSALSEAAEAYRTAMRSQGNVNGKRPLADLMDS